MKEIIRNATINDFKKGYTWSIKTAQFICLICGEKISNDNKQADIHVMEHGNPLERLLLLEKKYTGLTEIQKELIEMISNRNTDKNIASKFGCADSTVRNMKFALRERARQARAFLAVMELVDDNIQTSIKHKLRIFPKQEAKRKALLPGFADLFEPNKEYTEYEVKNLIKPIYDDDAIIRRYLIDYGYLIRNSDGSKYYKNCEDNIMNDLDRKELINKYKQQEVEMGIIKVYNTITGYSFVDICTNLYKPFESMKFQLNMGKFKLKTLQKDWNVHGEEAFTFEVIEKLKPLEGTSDKEKVDDLKELLQMWIDSQDGDLKLY